MIARLLLLLLLTATFTQAEENTAEASLTSPDGRFLFHAYSSDEANAGKPPFTILETATKKAVWTPDESLGDASRPEESILWSPDSKRFALTTRISTRRLTTLFFQWDGKAFQPMDWSGSGELESKADEDFERQIAFSGFSKEANSGRVIADDILPETWLDPDRVILVRKMDKSISAGDDENAVSASARALVVWNAENKAFEIDRFLPTFAPWPAEWTAPDFEVVQEEEPDAAEGSDMKKLTITHKQKNEELSFTAEGKMVAPTILDAYNGWPQIELICDGPPELFWRKLYRVEDGVYRCARIDEFTTHSAQAPEGKLKVAFSPGYEPYFVQSHITKDGDAESFESFTVEVPSPDKKHSAHLHYNPDYLEQVEIHDSAGSDEGHNIYDFEDGENGSVDTVCQVLWRPDSKAFAFYYNDGPRVGETKIYLLTNGVWKEQKLPKIKYPIAQEMQEKGAKWQNKFEAPVGWLDNQTLKLDLFGFFSGDDGIDYHYETTLKWDKKGKCSVGKVVEMPFEE